MKSFLQLLEELSANEIEKHLDKNTAIRLKNKTFKLRGRTNFAGIPISIENYSGDIRAGVDNDGEPWSQKMKFTYGFIPNKISADDGEGLDTYISDKIHQSDIIYSVKQHKIELVKKWPTDYCPKCNEHHADCFCPEYYDEDKLFLGFKNKQDVRESYLKQYDNPRFLGPISEIPIKKFKEILAGKGKKDKIKLPLRYK
jgi:hypothetical protein